MTDETSPEPAPAPTEAQQFAEATHALQTIINGVRGVAGGEQPGTDAELQRQLAAAIAALGKSEAENAALRARLADAARGVDAAHQQRRAAENEAVRLRSELARVRNLAALIRAGAPWAANRDNLADRLFAELDGQQPAPGTIATQATDGPAIPDHHTQQSAERGRDRHVAEEH